MSETSYLNSIDAGLPQLSALPTGADSSISENGRPATLSKPKSRGTTNIGIKICSMVILAAQELASHEDGLPVIQLEWVTDSVFVARSGDASSSSELIRRVRKICEDTPPASLEEVVIHFVNESNKELGTGVDASNASYTFTVGGMLHREQDCKLFLVHRDYKQHPSLYVSEAGDLLLAPTSCGKKFFTDDIRSKLQQAEKDYDRGLLSKIVKAFLADSCANSKTSKGRVTMVTVDARGFQMFESAEYDEAKGRYKESMFDEFYPVGYCTRES